MPQLVKLGLMTEEEEEEWDEEDYLHELPNGLADSIRECGGVEVCFSKLTSEKHVWILFICVFICVFMSENLLPVFPAFPPSLPPSLGTQ